jgi:hypothetical protein
MKKKLLVGVLALGSLVALGGSAVLAAPPQFGLSIHLDGGNNNPPPPPPDDDEDCLSQKAIFRGLADEGYRKFTNYEESDSGDDFTVDARRGSKWYELDVDACTGDVLDRTRITFPG